MKKSRFIIPAASLLLPGAASAATTDLRGVVTIVISYLNSALALIMGVAVVMFVYYVVQYFMRPSDKRAEGAQYVMWSLIGFFVILSFWGIVNILVSTFAFGQNVPGSWTGFFNVFPQ